MTQAWTGDRESTLTSDIWLDELLLDVCEAADLVRAQTHLHIEVTGHHPTWRGLAMRMSYVMRSYDCPSTEAVIVADAWQPQAPARARFSAKTTGGQIPAAISMRCLGHLVERGRPRSPSAPRPGTAPPEIDALFKSGDAPHRNGARLLIEAETEPDGRTPVMLSRGVGRWLAASIPWDDPDRPSFRSRDDLVEWTFGQGMTVERFDFLVMARQGEADKPIGGLSFDNRERVQPEPEELPAWEPRSPASFGP